MIHRKTPLHQAAQYNHPFIVEYLIKNHASSEVKDEYDNTPLHIASCYNNLEVIDCLILNGCNINATNNHIICEITIKLLYT